jgi:Type II secretion system (T2SS), protein E, N-terminal domain
MAAPRIGELLVQDGIVTAEARERALRSQAVHGGRLGTNLIEQFAIGLDELAEGLARRHDMPAAVDRHFNQADRSVQARLSPAIAARWKAVPLGRLPGDVERVAVAMLDPPSEEALAELGDALGAEVVAACAPELRVLYHLERVYGLERSNRFKRGARRVPGVATNERRGYVRTLTDSDIAPPSEPPTSLARIEVRRIERTRTGEIETLTDLALLAESLVAIRRAQGRMRASELLVGALEQGFDQVFDAGLLLTVRAGLLLGWKGFARGRDASSMEGVSGVAVPMHVPSLFADAC